MGIDTKTEITEEEYIEKLKEFEGHYREMLRIRQEVNNSGFAEPIGVSLLTEPKVQLSQYGKLAQDVSTGVLFGEVHFILEVEGTPYFRERKESLSKNEDN